MKKLLASLLLLTFSGSALAQDSWDWKVAPYLWMVGIDGTLEVGPINNELDVSFGDILDDLDIGGSVWFQGMRGQHGFHLDYTYLRLKPDPVQLMSPPFPPDSSLSQKMTINILEGAYNYKFETSGNTDAFMLLGARYMDIEVDLRSERGFVGLTGGPTLTDYFIGIQTDSPLGSSGKWRFGFKGTLGAGDTDAPWTAQAMFFRMFENDNRLAIGARVWNVEFGEENGIMGQPMSLDSTFAGLMVGYLFD